MAHDPRVIAGLGNPGPEYRGHRHNVGFMILDRLAARWGRAWTEDLDCAWSEGERGGRSVFLVKPLNYMNRSGSALVAWASRAGLVLDGSPVAGPDPAEPGETPDPAPEPGVRPLVVCDDLNLPLGSVRMRARGRSGGQNGLASVIEAVGGTEFPRLRLGVAPEGDIVDPADWADFVLRDFSGDETEAAASMVDQGSGALECWLDEGLEAAISRFNRRIRPDADPES